MITKGGKKLSNHWDAVQLLPQGWARLLCVFSLGVPCIQQFYLLWKTLEIPQLQKQQHHPTNLSW